MKKLTLLASILFLTVNSYSQWVYQNNIDSITTISSGSFINSNTGWYARSKGQISKTTDGGISWNTYTVDANDLNSIKFVNANTGYVCGNNGRLLKSINGGLNWSIQNPSSTDTLVSIDFVNELTGWCAGRDFIVYTTNGGSQWYRQNVDTSIVKPRFTVLKMYDSQNGLAGAYRKNANDMYAYIYRTSNGGVSWVFIDSIDGYRISSICYINQSIIYLSNYQRLYKSVNGGLNWSIKYIFYEYFFPKIQFLDENTGWYCKNSNINKTTNGGNNWITNINYSVGLFCELNYTTSGNLFVATNKGSIYKSTNEGTNWGNYSVNMESNLNNISIINENNIFVGGEFGAVWKSTNGGINWQNKFRESIGNITGPYFVNSNTGFLCSAERFFYKSTNAGENWIKVGNMLTQKVYNMYCKDENNIWVVGDSGMISKSSNSGLNWENKSFNSSLLVYGIIENNNILFIKTLAQEGGFYKSTNNGSNWINIPLDTIQYTFNLYFLNSQIGWIFSSYGLAFYKTSDGGNTWSKNFRNDLNLPLDKFCFVNENTGYAITYSYYNGLIKTTNSGFNWFTIENFPYYNNYLTTSVSFLNENTGWVVGWGGMILKTTNGGTSFISVNNQNIPDKYSLSQNYPNPFNPTTNIRYTIPSNVKGEMSDVKLVVFDILGKEIATLVNEKQDAGTYEATFDARHGGSSRLTSGIYFYRLTAGDFSETKKMLMIK